MIDPVLALLPAIGAGCLFLSAGVHKLRDFARFVPTLAAYRLLPAGWATVVAQAVIAAEIAAGAAALAMPVSPALGRAGALGCALLLGAYAAAIAINLLRGNTRIDCGCLGFGARVPELRWGLVGRNALLLAAVLAALLPVSPRPLVWLDAVTVLGGLALMALIHAGADMALHLPRKEIRS